jgi:hypothetical protein
MPAINAKACSGRVPAATSRPTALAFCAISRPCLAIQATCQPSIVTATSSTEAFSTSWPLPAKARAILAANSATRPAPTTPPAIPPPTQVLRPAIPNSRICPYYP